MRYSNTEARSVCPICSFPSGVLLWSVGAHVAARQFTPPEADALRKECLAEKIRQLWNGEKVDVIRCDRCDFTYASPNVGGDAEFYQLAHEDAGYPPWRWEFTMAKRSISDFPGWTPRVLEIGAGNGAFLSSIISDVSDASVVRATEFSALGRHEISKLGVQTYSLDIRELSEVELDGRFDFICLFQVLEHLDNVNALLRHLLTILNPGGELLISVPSEHRIQFNELNGALLDMPPNHIGRWTPRTFDVWAEIGGCKVVEHEYEPASYKSETSMFLRFRLLKRAREENLARIRIYAWLSRHGTLGRVVLKGLVLVDAILNLDKLVGLSKSVKSHGGGSQFVRIKKIESVATDHLSL